MDDPDPKPEAPDLATLRSLFGQPIPADSPQSIETQIRPGKWRKVYGRAPIERYMLRATKWDMRKEVKPLRTTQEISAEIDKRPLLELREQIHEVMGQIAVRAAAGDESAIHNLVAVARGIISVLETVERAQPKKLQKIAAESVNWPVLLSPNRQDIEHAKKNTQRLKVGERAPTPRRSGQKLDPRTFWTRLAADAFQACQEVKEVVPILKDQCDGITPYRRASKFWGFTVEADFYQVSSIDCIVITGWEGRCPGLSLPVSRENLKDWWYVVKHYVIEYWHGFPQEYDEALRQIGHKDDDEWQRRNWAVGRVEQAFRDLVKLR
jgi:hypothetical protein